MPNYILHKDGAYNVFSTVVDACYFEPALTLEQLRGVAPDNLAERLERAHATGCSAMDGSTLAECIACNRAGEREANLPRDEFIRRFLTLPAA